MIDASIYALQKPPAPLADPGEAMGRAMQIRNAQQTQQLNAERLKQEQQQTAMNERKMQSADALQRAYRESGGDLDKTESLAVQYGVDPDALAGLQQHKQNVIKGRLEISGKEDEQARAKRTERDSRMQGLLQEATGLAKSNPEAYAQNWGRIYQAAVAIDPETAKHASPDAPPSADDLNLFGLHYASQAWADKKAAEARAAAGEQRAATAATDTHSAAQLKISTDQQQQDAAALANAARQGPQALAQALAQLPEPRRTPFVGLTAQAKPEDILRVGMDPNQQMTTAATAARDKAAVEHQQATERHQTALEGIQRARFAMEGSTTVMAPNPDGSYRAVRVKPGESVPGGSISVAGMNSLTVPTAATRSMTEAAPKVQALVDRVEQLVNEQEKNLGPGSGRMREFLAGKIGAKDKEFSKLRTDVGLLQTALMRMHVGSRGGQQMMEHFKDLIDSSKQDPENLRAALGEIREYAKTVAGDHSGGGGGGGTVTVTDPRGVAHTFRTQKEADAFKSAAGIK